MLTTKTKIALARLAQRPVMWSRRLRGAGPNATVERRGLTWALDLNEGIDFAIYLLGAFEPETVRAYEKIVRPGMTVLDIGANVGAHTLHLARLVGDEGRVIAFEPTDWAFAKLTANLALNLEIARRVTPVQAFLVDRADREVEAEVPASWPLDGRDVHPQLRGRAMTAEAAVATTLDDWLAAADIPRVDFIKMDVDGHECGVLAGAEKMLARDRPTILMELSPYILEERGGSLDGLLDQLEAVGYRLFGLTDGAPLPQDRAALARTIPVGAGINAVARCRAVA
jgi:FkbM family methyltransferase